MTEPHAAFKAKVALATLKGEEMPAELAEKYAVNTCDLPIDE